MALESTVTSKGQTTLRKDVREHLGLETGDKVRHLIIGDEVRLVRPRKVMSVCGSLPHEGDPARLDEMNEAVRAGAPARQRRDR
ncbi:MAG: AbrB/MazE/SpoVT family DNA-binding domain-containing protein [Pseudomonadota bacterium]